MWQPTPLVSRGLNSASIDSVRRLPHEVEEDFPGSVVRGTEEVVGVEVVAAFEELSFRFPFGVSNETGQAFGGLVRIVAALDGHEKEGRFLPDTLHMRH